MKSEPGKGLLLSLHFHALLEKASITVIILHLDIWASHSISFLIFPKKPFIHKNIVIFSWLKKKKKKIHSYKVGVLYSIKVDEKHTLAQEVWKTEWQARADPSAMETCYCPSRAKTTDRNTPLFMKSLCSPALVRLLPKLLLWAERARWYLSGWRWVLITVRSRGVSEIFGVKWGGRTNRWQKKPFKKLWGKKDLPTLSI